MMRVLAISGVVVGAALIGSIPSDDGRCETAYFTYGVAIYGGCPVGTMRQTGELIVGNVRRTAMATATIVPRASYTLGPTDAVQDVVVPALDARSLALVDRKNVVTPLAAVWNGRHATFKVPDVPDGEYLLRATYRTALGGETLDAKLPLYTPARVHVLTDRPLYEPGNTVQFRALALRARDLSPLDGRPGTWVIKDPDGVVLLEESAPAGDWGVVAGSFPIDRQARTGTWKIAWTSGSSSDEITFKVEPFKLPRFRVEAATDRPFYRANERPKLTGAVVYASGAPVAKAKLELAWSVTGAWPAPSEWEATLLPKTAEIGRASCRERVLYTV